MAIILDALKSVPLFVYEGSIFLIALSVALFYIMRLFKTVIDREMEDNGENGGEKAVLKLKDYIALIKYSSIGVPALVVIGFIVYIIIASK